MSILGKRRPDYGILGNIINYFKILTDYRLGCSNTTQWVSEIIKKNVKWIMIG